MLVDMLTSRITGLIIIIIFVSITTQVILLFTATFFVTSWMRLWFLKTAKMWLAM